MLPRIPIEANYTRWLMNCIESYFNAIGYTVHTEEQSQALEKHMPFDIYARINKGNVLKRFGLQVKRPYQYANGDLYWEIDRTQDNIIKKIPSIFYAFPDFIDRKYYAVACHHVRITRPIISYKHHLRANTFNYYRFGHFAKQIVDCLFGQEIKSNVDFDSALITIEEYDMINNFHMFLDITQQDAMLIYNISKDEIET